MIKKSLSKITGNFSVKCEFCKKPVKRKNTLMEEVKKPEWVYPKKANFCSKKCIENYKEYSESRPKSVSLCSSCPVPRALVENE